MAGFYRVGHGSRLSRGAGHAVCPDEGEVGVGGDLQGSRSESRANTPSRSWSTTIPMECDGAQEATLRVAGPGLSDVKETSRKTISWDYPIADKLAIVSLVKKTPLREYSLWYGALPSLSRARKKPDDACRGECRSIRSAAGGPLPSKPEQCRPDLPRERDGRRQDPLSRCSAPRRACGSHGVGARGWLDPARCSHLLVRTSRKSIYPERSPSTRHGEGDPRYRGASSIVSFPLTRSAEPPVFLAFRKIFFVRQIAFYAGRFCRCRDGVRPTSTQVIRTRDTWRRLSGGSLACRLQNA
jgi:hypothetical protein